MVRMFKEFGLDELAKELERLGKVDEYAPEMLSEAGPILEKELKKEVSKEVNRGYAKGDLKKSIKSMKPGRNQYGYYIAVTATGKDRKGVRNNEKLAYLEYGTSKQEARPIIGKAVVHSEDACLRKMQEKFNEVTGK